MENERLKAIKFDVLIQYIASMENSMGSQAATEFEQGFDKACQIIASFASALEDMELYTHKEGILNDFRM